MEPKSRRVIECETLATATRKWEEAVELLCFSKVQWMFCQLVPIARAAQEKGAWNALRIWLNDLCRLYLICQSFLTPGGKRVKQHDLRSPMSFTIENVPCLPMSLIHIVNCEVIAWWHETGFLWWCILGGELVRTEKFTSYRFQCNFIQPAVLQRGNNKLLILLRVGWLPQEPTKLTGIRYSRNFHE